MKSIQVRETKPHKIKIPISATLEELIELLNTVGFIFQVVIPNDELSERLQSFVDKYPEWAVEEQPIGDKG